MVGMNPLVVLATLSLCVPLLAGPAAASEIDCTAANNPFPSDEPGSLLERISASAATAAQQACAHDAEGTAEAAGELPGHLEWYATQTSAATLLFAEERLAAAGPSAGGFADQVCTAMLGQFMGGCAYVDPLTP